MIVPGITLPYVTPPLGNFEKRWMLKIAPFRCFQKAYILSELKQYDEAILEYRRGLEIMPDHTGARDNLISILIGLQCFEEALEIVRRAFHKSPNAEIKELYFSLLGHLRRSKELFSVFGVVSLVIDPKKT